MNEGKIQKKYEHEINEVEKRIKIKDIIIIVEIVVIVVLLITGIVVLRKL